MKQGIHKHLLAESLAKADKVLIYAGEDVQWDIEQLVSERISTFNDTALLLDQLYDNIQQYQTACNVLIMSNGGFENLYQRLTNRLS